MHTCILDNRTVFKISLVREYKKPLLPHRVPNGSPHAKEGDITSTFSQPGVHRQRKETQTKTDIIIKGWGTGSAKQTKRVDHGMGEKIN